MNDEDSNAAVTAIMRRIEGYANVGLKYIQDKGGFNDDAAEDEVAPTKKHFRKEGIEIVQPAQPAAPESVLKTIAKVVMVFGVIISVALLIFGIYQIDNYEQGMGFAAILSIIPILLSSVVTWALLRVFCNISTNIKEISDKLNR